MKTLYNQSELIRSANENTALFSQNYIGAADENTKFDIFLSHSYIDKYIVKGLLAELIKCGYNTYVDWESDDDLSRDNVTKKSAERIRNRMRHSTTLLLALPANKSQSKWIPWELGFMDGYNGKCAIIPIAEADTTAYHYERAEYLKLYPYFIKEQNGRNTSLFIRDEGVEDILFNTWYRYKTTKQKHL